jgi:hypothetical protein
MVYNGVIGSVEIIGEGDRVDDDATGDAGSVDGVVAVVSIGEFVAIDDRSLCGIVFVAVLHDDIRKINMIKIANNRFIILYLRRIGEGFIKYYTVIFQN